MTQTIEIRDDLKERLDEHMEEGESYDEFIGELVAMYETDGAFLREGYSE
jgi:predicted CopG family antitoxin